MRELAEDIGEKHDTVLRWRLRRRIPSEKWALLIERAAARDRVITADLLMTLSAPPKRRGRPGAPARA